MKKGFAEISTELNTIVNKAERKILVSENRLGKHVKSTKVVVSDTQQEFPPLEPPYFESFF